MVKIILASSSPRRIELLKGLNIDFQTKKVDIDEKINIGDNPRSIAMGLSFEKAYEAAKSLDSHCLVIGADTIVVNEGRIIGKPKDYDDAFSILRDLSDKEHEVLTGISLINLQEDIKIIDYEKTIVKFRKLSDDKINSYLSTKEYIGKAGAYGIQGFGSILVQYIKGCYFNVMGLPLYRLDINLEKYFNLKLL